MEFWGVEVKSGEPLKVLPGDGMILHLSQASLGELKKGKGNDSARLFVKVDEKKLVLGTLSVDMFPQQQFDLVFDRDFELSHNWKSRSVYFCGYKATNPVEKFAATELPEVEFDDSESEEDIPLHLANNGKPELIAKKDKPAEAERASAIKEKKSDAGKQKVKIVEPKKDEGPLEEESSDDDFITSEDDEEDDFEDEDDSDDDSDESDDEETPQKVEPIKKRPVDSAIKTPVPEKKGKSNSTEICKKGGGHVATPHPAKQAGKTPGNQPNKQTPKSRGAHSCKSCNKTFGSDQALDSHTKAKHGK